MHGRLKVKTTEEQAEAKRIERLKQQKLYQAATTRIFQKRAASEYDDEALQITGNVLSKNSDVYTLWSYRCEILEHMGLTKSTEDMKNLYDSELQFLQECLKGNPKSYGCWQHRCFCMLNTPEPNWTKELTLCNQFLEYDERNFHCWDYRRFVVKNSNVQPNKELEFTTEKISKNFSNYSSWHYRSKLLAKIFPDDSQSSGVQKDRLLGEFELAQNAFFTDPNDQSAWFYHRWLLGRGNHQPSILNCKNDEECKTIILTFSQAIPPPRVDCKDEEQFKIVNWRSPDIDQYCSCTWVGELPSGTENCPALILVIDWEGEELHLPVDPQSQSNQSIYNFTQLFSQELSDSANEILVQELDSCEQLFELEPENKWVLLTIVLLMHALDSVKYKQDIAEKLDQLTRVDPHRSNYYKDMKSRFIIEEALISLPEGSTTLDLSSRGLTCLYHTNMMFHIQHLDISGNSLTTLYGLENMTSLESLNAANNSLTSCEELSHAPSLKKADLSNNKLAHRTIGEESSVDMTIGQI